MGKRGGLGCQLYVSGYDLGDDIREFGTRCPVATFDLTSITKSAMERGLGQRDGGLAVTAFFNPTAGRVHKRLSLLPTDDQLITVNLGSTLGDPSFSLGKQTNYDPSRDQSGMLTFAGDYQANAVPLDIGRLLTPGVRTTRARRTAPAMTWGPRRQARTAPSFGCTSPSSPARTSRSSCRSPATTAPVTPGPTWWAEGSRRSRVARRGSGSRPPRSTSSGTRGSSPSLRAGSRRARSWSPGSATTPRW